MRAPQFWWQPKPNLVARLLAPLGSVYGAVTAQRMGAQGARAPLPVICVGNFVAGGAGKTPTALALAKLLQAKGENPVFLSRGYRGKAGAGPLPVDVTRHTASDVGDEALLLARVAPTIVGRDRVVSARLAKDMGASLVIFDDGLQNPSLVQDLRLAVVDGASGHGNGLCVPAGPLRAPFFGQLACVSAVLVIGEGAGEGEAMTWLSETTRAFGKPVLMARFVPQPEIAEGLSGRKVVAFAGIGLPEKFRQTLEGLGAKIVGWQSFADHHAHSTAELRRLQAQAAGLDALLVTTEKDFVRLAPALVALDPNLPQPLALPVTLNFDDGAALTALLSESLRTARAKKP
jgi:tetraacyldisaccharide 4'-kinase